MDHSYADPESTDLNDSVVAPPADDHYISDEIKKTGEMAVEDDKSEDNNDKLVIAQSPSPKTNSSPSCTPDGDKNKQSVQLVDQNQNSSVLSDQEAKDGDTNKSKMNNKEDLIDQQKAMMKTSTEKVSKGKREVCMDADENSCGTTTTVSATGDEEVESSKNTSKLDDSQNTSMLNDSQNDSTVQAEEDGYDSDTIEALISNISKFTANLDMEMLTRPFKEGWKREVVQRNVFQKYSDTGKRKSKPVDIYYFTPEGRKLRSMIQITDYLNKTSSVRLPLECFCFMRKPIYREPFEIVRSAGKARRPLDTYSSPTIKKGRPAKVNKTSPKPTTKSGRSRPAIPEPEVVIERDEEEFYITPYLDMAVESSKKRALDDSDANSTPLQPPVKKKATARKSTTPRPPSASKPPKPMIDINRHEGQLCTINCPGLEGQPPQLQCSVCMCLFHPRCVNVPDDNIPATFNCLRCKSIQGNGIDIGESGKKKNSYFSTSIPSTTGTSTYTLVFPKTSSNGGVPSISSTISSTLRSYLDSKSPSTVISPPPLKAATTLPSNYDIPPLPPLMPANSNIPRTVLPLVNTSPGIQPPKLTAAPGKFPTRPVLAPSITLTPNSQLGLTPQTPVVVQKPSKETPVNAQLLTLPAAVTKRLNLSQPLALKINNVHIVVPPNCVINSKEGLKVVLPPNTFGLPSDPNAKLNVTVSNNSGSMENFKSVTESSAASEEINESSRTNISASVKNTTKMKRTCVGINPANCFIKRLYGGYDCMLFIFRYLSTNDLLRAGQVCRTWHHISRQSSLWRVVRLKDMKIPDWETASKFIRKVGVESLSLKGLHHYDDRNRTWHMLMANLHNLVALREIKFGLVPATVLHSVCEKLQSLEVFSAEFISDTNAEQMWNTPTKIDVGKFSTLQHLRELRLRGVGGLVLPSFSQSGSLSEVTSLKQLEVLSLTTLRSFQDSEFHFLSEMQKLSTLEIGDCSTWTDTYQHLGKLSNLKRLRLECGGDLKNTSLAEALVQLEGLEQLELVMFLVPDNLSGIMEKLQKLHRFVIWPDTSEETEDDIVNSPALVNSNTLNSIGNLKKLQYLEWGIINNSDSSCSTSTTNTLDSKMEIIKFCPGQFDTDAITIQQLTEKLCTIMPDTEKIRVFKTQALSHTKYKNRES